jgi:hypothetical protein
LVKKCEAAALPISKSSLSNFVGLAMMARQLSDGGKAFKQLSMSHQTTLLPLRTPSKVEKMAEVAVSKKLSVRALRASVAAKLSKSSKDDEDGTKRARAILKMLDRAAGLFPTDKRQQPFNKEVMDELSDERAESALATMKELADSLAKLVEKLEARVKASASK